MESYYVDYKEFEKVLAKVMMRKPSIDELMYHVLIFDLVERHLRIMELAERADLRD